MTDLDALRERLRTEVRTLRDSLTPASEYWRAAYGMLDRLLADPEESDMRERAEHFERLNGLHVELCDREAALAAKLAEALRGIADVHSTVLLRTTHPHCCQYVDEHGPDCPVGAALTEYEQVHPEGDGCPACASGVAHITDSHVRTHP